MTQSLPNPEQQPHLPISNERAERYRKSITGYAERMLARVDTVSEFIAPRNQADPGAPENIARGPIVFGAWLMLICFGIFGLWSALAPLDSAAIARGVITPDSNKKTVQHLEGGLIKEILVSEGEAVKKGQPLVILDPTTAQAKNDMVGGQLITALAMEARLLAERDSKEEVSFPPELTEAEAKDPEVAENMDSQRRLFASRRDTLNGSIDVLSEKMKQYEQEIDGLSQQIKSAQSQMGLLGEEISVVRQLLKKGNAVKPRLLSLQRQYAALGGQKGEYESKISQAKQSINETQIQIYNTKSEFQSKLMNDLKDTQAQISDLQDRMKAASDVLNRIEIKAPIAGQVTGLNVHTVGGVVAPGDKIMDIVPFDDKLIVEVKVPTQDIDSMHPGLKARVRLLAYKQRSVRPVQGEVTIVSADRFSDQRTGESYYTARIEIPQSEIDDISRPGHEVKLTPGMPVEALILTGSRTLLGYLVSPIRDYYTRAFREQ